MKLNQNGRRFHPVSHSTTSKKVASASLIKTTRSFTPPITKTLPASTPTTMTGIATVTNTIAPTFSQLERETKVEVELLSLDLCPAMVLQREGTGWLSVGYVFRRAPSWEVADGAGSRSCKSVAVGSPPSAPGVTPIKMANARDRKIRGGKGWYT